METKETINIKTLTKAKEHIISTRIIDPTKEILFKVYFVSPKFGAVDYYDRSNWCLYRCLFKTSSSDSYYGLLERDDFFLEIENSGYYLISYTGKNRLYYRI